MVERAVRSAILQPRTWRHVIGGAGGGAASLSWWEDFRTSLTDRGLVAGQQNATINRIPVAQATGTWPAGITHVAQNVYVATMNASYVALNLWPDPAVGQYLFGRMLVVQAVPANANTGGDHGMQSNINGPVAWFWRLYGTDHIGGDPNLWLIDAATWDAVYPNYLEVPNVPKNTVIRLEWRVERTGAAGAILTARVYNNQTGALLGERAGMVQTAAAGGGANPFRQYEFGMSGQGGATYTGGSTYWGALAFRVSSFATDWIGAYPVAGVES